MKALTEKQKQSLLALWQNLPGNIRKQMLAAASAQGQIGEVLLEINALAGFEQPKAPDELLSRFRIFKDIIGEDEASPTHARFSEAQLRDVERVCKLDLDAWQQANGDPNQQQVWRNQAAAKLDELLTASASKKGEQKKLIDALGAAYPEDLGDIACLLRNDEALHLELSKLPKKIPSFSEELVTQVRNAYDRICSDAPDASLWLLKIVTARLERTAQIFRAVEKIGKRLDDALVSKTDLADIGDLVLSNAEFFASRFAQPPKTLQEAETAGQAVAEYVAVTVGMTREFGIRKDGRWGKTLFGIRSRASESLEGFFKHVEKTFSRALPHPAKGHRGLAKPGAMPDAARIAQAEADLRFLALTGEWASQAAVGSAQKHAADFVREEMDECARALLEILRTAEGIDSDQASEAIALCVRYMRAFKDDENAHLIQRRAVAVRANAA